MLLKTVFIRNGQTSCGAHSYSSSELQERVCQSQVLGYYCRVSFIAAWKANIDTKSDSLISGYTQLHISEDIFTFCQWSASRFYATWTQRDELRWILRGTEKQQVPCSRPAWLYQILGNKSCTCCNANVSLSSKRIPRIMELNINKQINTTAQSLYSSQILFSKV